MKDVLRVSFSYFGYGIKANFQYKMNAFLLTIAVFIREMSAVVAIYLTLSKFPTVDGWNLPELLFMYSFVFITYSIMISFCTGLRDFSQMINSGSFDRLLLRPRGALFQVMTLNVDWLAVIGQGAVGVVLLIYSSHAAGIEWDLVNVIYYIAAIISGVLFQSGLFLIIASLNFYFVKTQSVQKVVYYDVKKLATYPITIYPHLFKILLVYIVPFAFVNYYPALFFFPEKSSGSGIYIALSSIIGGVYYFISYLFWRFSLSRYNSTGN